CAAPAVALIPDTCRSVPALPPEKPPGRVGSAACPRAGIYCPPPAATAPARSSGPGLATCIPSRSPPWEPNREPPPGLDAPHRSGDIPVLPPAAEHRERTA